MIVIPSRILKDIIAQCNRERPNEACGILAGKIQQTNSVVTKNITRVYPCVNELSSPKQYKISAEEQYHAFSDIEDLSLNLIGFYHSHPRGPSEPSTIDKEQANYIGYTYLIITLRPFQVTAWIFRKDREFMPEPWSIEN